MYSPLGKRGAILTGMLALALAAVTPAGLSAKPEPGSRGRGFRMFARPLGAMTINRIYCGLDSSGQVCVDSLGSSTIGGGFWPKGTANQYVFNSGLQIAGIIGADGGPLGQMIRPAPFSSIPRARRSTVNRYNPSTTPRASAITSSSAGGAASGATR
jgi:hypothetical protein